MNQNYIINELKKTKKTFNQILKSKSLVKQIEKVAEECCKSIKKGNKIMFCGNGGSAADSQHLAAEIVGRFAFDRPPLPAIALTVDTSVLTAIGNDYGYRDVFARQVKGIGKEGDIIIGISTSGKSINIVEALKVARQMGIITVGLVGKVGRDVKPVADYCINIPATNTAKIQEAHISIGHIICGIIENNFFNEKKSVIPR